MKRYGIVLAAVAISLACVVASVLYIGGYLDAGVGMARDETGNPIKTAGESPSPSAPASQPSATELAADVIRTAGENLKSVLARTVTPEERVMLKVAGTISDEIRAQLGKKGTPYENWRKAETLSITGSPPETQPASSESLPPKKPENAPPEIVPVIPQENIPPENLENLLVASARVISAEEANLENLLVAKASVFSAEEASKLENVRLAENAG